jgi:hypothetical protein
MDIKWLVSVLFILAGNIAVKGQENCPLNILPQSVPAKGWFMRASPVCFTGDKLFDAIDGGAEVYIEYGFISMARVAYSKKKAILDVEVYMMAGTDASYGILTTMSEGPPPVPNQGSIIVRKNYYGLMVKGKYFIIVTDRAGSGKLGNETERMLENIGKKINEGVLVPEMIRTLQVSNLTKTVFFNGDIVLSNNYHFGVSRPFDYEQGVYLVTSNGPVIIFKCRQGSSMTDNIKSTLESLQKTGKYVVDYEKFIITDSKGTTFRIRSAGNEIIMSAEK